jgi:hypothetical protein
MKKVGFYINNGIEVRYFLLSGLADLLRKTYDICLLVNETHSKVLEEYALKYQIETLTLPEVIIKPPRWEKYIRSFTNSRKRAQNVAIYSHHGANYTDKRRYDILVKGLLSNQVIVALIKKMIQFSYQDSAYKSFLRKSEIENIFVLDYSSPQLKQLGINASFCGIRTSVFINSLKVVFIDDFVTFPFFRLYSWNKMQNQLFQSANIDLDTSLFRHNGSPYHNFLRTIDEDYQAKVLEKYAIDPSKKVILYSMINEKVYDKEYLLLELIVNMIKTNFSVQERPILVIRRNPFEQNDSHIRKIAQLEGLIIAEHFWERKPEKEWSIQKQEGELEWRALLQFATVSMNIPSMATIDTLMCGTPVINIGFNEKGDYNRELDFLIESPFNLEFKKNDFVVTVRKFEDLDLCLEEGLTTKIQYASSKIRNSVDINISDLERFIDMDGS